MLDRSKSKSAALLPSRAICSGGAAKDTSAAPGVALKAAVCPWGSPEAFRQLGTRRGLQPGPPSRQRGIRWLPLLGGAVIAAFEKFLLSGQRQRVCLKTARSSDGGSQISLAPWPGSPPTRCGVLACGSRSHCHQSCGEQGPLIPKLPCGAAASPRPWAVCQGLLSPAELGWCVRVPPCCPPGQPVWV